MRRGLRSALVFWLGSAFLSTAALARAADRPIAATDLELRDASHPMGPFVRFRSLADPGIGPAPLPDPRVAGATLEVVGTGAGDGGSGVLPLPPSLWSAVGTASDAGYVYADPTGAHGVRRIVFRAATGGGRLTVRGGGPAWPYQLAQAQQAIDVRLTVGGQVYCARLSSFSTNGADAVVAGAAPAPGACAARVARCGNGVLEGAEECDDGDLLSGDGCDAACAVESADGLCAGVPESPNPALTAVLVADGLSAPLFATAPPLDVHRLFVVEQGGAIRVVKDGALLDTPFLDLSASIASGGELGLLSMAFHPDFASNGRFFVAYTDPGGSLAIARFAAPAGSDVADPATKRVLLRIAHPGASNHNGGQLGFGPDGKLYVTTGDGGGGGDPNRNAQNDSSMLGKLLRLDVDVETRPFRAVPPDNPHPNAPGRLGLIWAKGLRNAWRFGFDRATGDLYLADVGQGAVEEVDFQPASSHGGENYGWNVFEGTSCFDPTPAPMCPSPPAGYTMPVLEYDHAGGGLCGGAVIGGFAYRGCRIPSLRGTYFYGDYCHGFVRSFRGVSGGVAQEQQERSAELAPGGGRDIHAIGGFGEDARGELYVLDLNDGEVFRIEPR